MSLRSNREQWQATAQFFIFHLRPLLGNSKIIRMRKHSILLCVLAMAAMLLAGCGEAMYELTPEEEAIITSYAAHIVAKYNKKQPEGYTYVYVSPETAEEIPAEEVPAAVSDDEAQEPEQDTSAGETEVSGNEADNPGSDGMEGDSGEDQTEENGPAMARALGIKGARLVYTGIQFTSIYDTVYPEPGNKLMILHFSLVNEKDSKLKVSVLDASPVFRASLNGESAVTGDISILSDDLSTYAGEIPAGESDNVMLLFQVPVNADETVNSLKLQIRADGSSSTFTLQ